MKIVLLSSLLKKKYPKIFNDLIYILKKYNITFELVNNTNDIWIRDYMPFYLEDKSLVSYKYEPDYLKEKKYQDIKTYIKPNPNHLNIVLDGGNFVRHKHNAIMTDKIFSENQKLTKNEIMNQISSKCKLNELIIIPKQPYDLFGHSDSMTRFINKNKVLVNDFSNESKSFNIKLINSLKKRNLEIEFLKYNKSFFTKDRNWGAYLNYLELDNLLIIPVYGIEHDIYVLNQFKKIFPKKNIEVLLMNEVIKEGGALHCITALKEK